MKIGKPIFAARSIPASRQIRGLSRISILSMPNAMLQKPTFAAKPMPPGP